MKTYPFDIESMGLRGVLDEYFDIIEIFYTSDELEMELNITHDFLEMERKICKTPSSLWSKEQTRWMNNLEEIRWQARFQAEEAG